MHPEITEQKEMVLRTSKDFITVKTEVNVTENHMEGNYGVLQKKLYEASGLSGHQV